MIKPKDRDNNRSRDVLGPKLLRSYDGEKTMGDKSLFHDDHPTGTISKHDLSELHDGDHESPLTASGKQEVVMASPMGHDYPDHRPTLHKGGVKDQSQFGKGGTSYPKESKSMGSRAPKGEGRSIAKDIEYSAKKRMK